MTKRRIPSEQAEDRARALREKLNLSTAEIGLTVRTTNCLEEKGIFTVRDLLNRTPKELLSISNFGENSLEEVYAALAIIGYNRPHRSPDSTTEIQAETQAHNEYDEIGPEHRARKSVEGEVSEPNLAIVFDSRFVTPEEYAELVRCLGDLARANGAAGLVHLDSQGFDLLIAKDPEPI